VFHAATGILEPVSECGCCVLVLCCTVFLAALILPLQDMFNSVLDVNANPYHSNPPIALPGLFSRRLSVGRHALHTCDIVEIDNSYIGWLLKAILVSRRSE
jgi:hypothetical protein